MLKVVAEIDEVQCVAARLQDTFRLGEDVSKYPFWNMLQNRH